MKSTLHTQTQFHGAQSNKYANLNFSHSSSLSSSSFHSNCFFCFFFLFRLSLLNNIKTKTKIRQSVSSSTLSQFNTEALKLSAMGVSIFAATGDNGVVNFGCGCSAGTTSMYNCACKADSSSSILSWSKKPSWTGTGYFPSFPATCPYVTAVGATMGPNGNLPSEGNEIACQVCCLFLPFFTIVPLFEFLTQPLSLFLGGRGGTGTVI